MTTGSRHASERFLSLLTEEGQLDDCAQRLRPKTATQSAHFPGGSLISPEVLQRRWQLLGQTQAVQAELLDAHTAAEMASYVQHIENFIGNPPGK